MLGAEPWCIDDLNYRDGVLEITGWALAPEGQHAAVTFMVNDREFEEISFPLPRPDIGEVFWYKRGAALAQFRCRSGRVPEETRARGYLNLRCVHRETRLPFREEFDYFYPCERDEPPMPSVERRKRVSGGESAEVFRLEGFTTFIKLDRALRRTFNKGISKFASVLDWGCGCGRVTRYLLQSGTAAVTGIDIDPDNVRWCQENFAAGTFLHVPLHPPVDLERAAFDLIIGISVFTHLKMRDQIEWLYELMRVAKTGGVLLMTVLGAAAVSRARYSPSVVREWQTTGFIAHENLDLKGYIEDDSYYVNTCMTTEYIRQNWSRFFEVVDIIPAYIGNMQDLVILRKVG
jgi:SAM-dependent methyltransferase